MINEKEAVEKMRSYPNLRDDLFTLKRVCEATGLSRTMLVKLEKEGFITPCKVNKENGWRYYDTFSIFKLLQYKRLRSIGLSQKEVFEFYQSGNETLLHTEETLRKRKRMLDESLEILSMRLDKEKNYSFSFYDFDEMTCLTLEGEIHDLVDSNTFGYNLSVETIARGLRPLETEYMFSERLSESPVDGGTKAAWRAKIYQPIDPRFLDGVTDRGIESVPACHTFSILVYGLKKLEDLQEPKRLLIEEIKKRELIPTGAPVRVQAVVAKYTAMQLEEDEHVMRFAIPVER